MTSNGGYNGCELDMHIPSPSFASSQRDKGIRLFLLILLPSFQGLVAVPLQRLAANLHTGIHAWNDRPLRSPFFPSNVISLFFSSPSLHYSVSTNPSRWFVGFVVAVLSLLQTISILLKQFMFHIIPSFLPSFLHNDIDASSPPTCTIHGCCRVLYQSYIHW